MEGAVRLLLHMTAAQARRRAGLARAARGLGGEVRRAARLEQLDELGRERAEVDQQRLVVLEPVEFFLGHVEREQEKRVLLVRDLDVEQRVLGVVGGRDAVA